MDLDSFKKIDSQLEIIQPPSTDLRGVSSIEDPQKETLVFLKSRGHLKKVGRFSNEKDFQSSTVLVERKLWTSLNETYLDDLQLLKSAFGGVLVAENLDNFMLHLSEAYYPDYKKEEDIIDGRKLGSAKIHPSAQIAEGVFIGDGVEVGAHAKIFAGCCIGAGAKIGEGTTLFFNCSIYEGVEIGKNCRIHANVSLGADGFGYIFSQGSHQKIWHIGGLIIGNSVEIGANSAVDRGTYGNTVIGDGCKIDNLVQIGHNCHFGKHVVICGQSAIGGSVVVEDYVVAGGMVALCDNITVGKATKIAGFSAPSNDVPSGSIIAGVPAKDRKDWIREISFLKRESRK